MSEDQGTILIVEDDVRMQKVLDRLFHEEGYRTEIASDGQAGVALFGSYSPLAVVLDLILPKLSGREVCKYMKSTSPDTPVLILRRWMESHANRSPMGNSLLTGKNTGNFRVFGPGC
jgi:DNA-binding response OmpR family regulator